MNHRNTPLTAGLYLVATPIGSARDITLRSLDILASCDLIVAEDTRTARKLLDIHGVPLNGRRMIAYHDHSGDNSVQGIVKLIADGKSVAYVSEAGTPLVADPGFELGREVIAQGLTVTAAPGASAVLAALTVSGLPTDRFMFAGFLPAARAQRQTEIAALRDMPLTMIFYESPKRIQEMLEDLREILGGSRDVAVCRELTKKFEEVTRGTLDEVIDAYDGRSVKGELVVLVGRAGATDGEEMDVETALRQAMETMRVKDAATAVAGALGLPKRQVYQIALGLSKED